MTETDKKDKPSPWIPGIIETMVGAALLRQSTIGHRNRLAVILLDSAFETACRAYLRFRAKITLGDAHKHRETLVKTVKSKLTDVDEVVWEVLDFNYTEIRCDFYHQSASKTITDESFLDYQEAIEFVVDRLLGIRSSQMVKSQVLSMAKTESDLATAAARRDLPSVHGLPDKVDKLVVAVAALSPHSVEEVNEFFRKEGESLRLSQEDFSRILGMNRGSKKLFYHNKQIKVWELSGLGEFRIGQLGKGEES